MVKIIYGLNSATAAMGGVIPNVTLTNHVETVVLISRMK